MNILQIQLMLYDSEIGERGQFGKSFNNNHTMKQAFD